ncbi:MAG: hypothetical protein RL036_509 [Actinomycetota bacterium]|jgi:hypothetical protein
MAKKLDLHELLELLPAISEIWDDATAGAKKASAATSATAKQAAKRVAKEAKNPVYGWVAVGLAIAVTAVVAYSVLKPEEDDLWTDVRTESTED